MSGDVDAATVELVRSAANILSVTGALTHGTTFVAKNNGATAITAGSPVIMDMSTSGSGLALARWDSQPTESLAFTLAVRTLGSAIGPLVGVATRTIMPGATGEIASSGCITTVRCAAFNSGGSSPQVTDGTGALVNLCWATAGAVSGSVTLDPNPSLTPGTILGVVVLMPVDAFGATQNYPTTGKNNYAGVLINPF